MGRKFLKNLVKFENTSIKLHSWGLAYVLGLTKMKLWRKSGRNIKSSLSIESLLTRLIGATDGHITRWFGSYMGFRYLGRTSWRLMKDHRLAVLSGAFIALLSPSLLPKNVPVQEEHKATELKSWPMLCLKFHFSYEQFIRYWTFNLVLKPVTRVPINYL